MVTWGPTPGCAKNGSNLASERTPAPAGLTNSWHVRLIGVPARRCAHALISNHNSSARAYRRLHAARTLRADIRSRCKTGSACRRKAGRNGGPSPPNCGNRSQSIGEDGPIRCTSPQRSSARSPEASRGNLDLWMSRHPSSTPTRSRKESRLSRSLPYRRLLSPAAESDPLHLLEVRSLVALFVARVWKIRSHTRYRILAQLRRAHQRKQTTNGRPRLFADASPPLQRRIPSC